MVDMYDGLLEELECKICMIYMEPPIRQCETGHSICHPCKVKLQRCPICQGQFTEARNIALESLACKIRYPCQNSNIGCQLRLTIEERKKHEQTCSFKPYKCAFPNCKWMGKYEDVLKHWTDKKQTGRTFRDVAICHTKVNRAENYYVNIVEAHKQLFWFKFKNSSGILFWIVQLIGSESNAKDYYFEIEIIKPGEPVRKHLMSDYCYPESASERDSCAMTTTVAIDKFFGEDQLLIYYLRVKNISDVTQTEKDRQFEKDYVSDNSPPGRSQNFKPPYPKRGQVFHSKYRNKN